MGIIHAEKFRIKSKTKTVVAPAAAMVQMMNEQGSVTAGLNIKVFGSDNVN